jgi:hypothetical protein
MAREWFGELICFLERVEAITCQRAFGKHRKICRDVGGGKKLFFDFAQIGFSITDFAINLEARYLY